MKFFEMHVLPNLRAYEVAEERLSHVVPNDTTYDDACNEALRTAMNAGTSAHHVADHVFETYFNQNQATIYNSQSLSTYREYLGKHRCLYIGSAEIVDDVGLLAAVVDSYKHLELRNKTRPITSFQNTMISVGGYGSLPYGEGKYGGTQQVVVHLSAERQRAFMNVVGNVIEMWTREIQVHSLQ